MATQEFSVKLGKLVITDHQSGVIPPFLIFFFSLFSLDSKEYNIMRFKPPHTCDLQQLTNVNLKNKKYIYKYVIVKQ